MRNDTYSEKVDHKAHHDASQSTPQCYFPY